MSFTKLGSSLIPILVLVAAQTSANAKLTEKGTEKPRTRSPDFLLRPVQDESTLEREIGRYLSTKDGVQAEEKYTTEDKKDLLLVYQLKPNAAPVIKCIVDTQVSGKEGNEVIERVIKVTAFYVLPDRLKTPKMRAKLLEAINEHHRRYWAPQKMYLDQDGDLVLDNAINIPGQDVPVHAEMVRDVILRTISGFSEFYQVLVRDFGLPKVSRNATQSSDSAPKK